MDMLAKRDKRFFVVWVFILFIILIGLAPMSGATASVPTGLPAQQDPGKDSGSSVPGSTNGSGPGSQGQPSGGKAATGPLEVKTPLKSDVSPPLRDIKPIPPQHNLVAPENENEEIVDQKGYSGPDPVLQRFFSPLVVPTPSLNFAGTGNVNGVAPPDTQGEVGLNHYVQWINSSFQIFTKGGGSVYGPANGNTIWDGFGGLCEFTNRGDPITLYDQLADRWFMSQFAFNVDGSNNPIAPFDQCIAVSTTGDPTGSYYRYEYTISNTVFNDYPKFGMWPDGYYMSTVNINSAGSFASSYAVAFDRAKMLVGDATAGTELFSVSNTFQRILPTDLDGFTLPPSGAPNYFASINGTSNFNIWEFHVDWDTPANSTFTGPTTLTTATFDQDLCSAGRAARIDQPGVTTQLEAISDRPMFRLAYRNFDDHESLIANHTVDADGAGTAGIRWYEIRNLSGSPTIYQQGTYSPNSTHRWMGYTMDRKGNMMLGYSASSTSVFPSMRYTGRQVDDALGTMQTEVNMQTGGGSQTGCEGTSTAACFRWGDYSDMTVDPVDDCTFWFTSEYVQSNGIANWLTRVGSFKFPSCKPAVCGVGSDYLVSSEAGAFVNGSTDIGNHCDDCTTLVNLPFSVEFYGTNYSSLRASSNGNVQFTGNTNTFSNFCLPAATVGDAIFPYWDNLLTDQAGDGIFTSTTGIAPNRAFNIEWDACVRQVGGGCVAAGDVNFVLRLFEGQHRFEIIYNVVYQGGTAATVGAQGPMEAFTPLHSRVMRLVCTQASNLSSTLDPVAVARVRLCGYTWNERLFQWHDPCIRFAVRRMHGLHTTTVHLLLLWRAYYIPDRQFQW